MLSFFSQTSHELVSGDSSFYGKTVNKGPLGAERSLNTRGYGGYHVGSGFLIDRSGSSGAGTGTRARGGGRAGRAGESVVKLDRSNRGRRERENVEIEEKVEAQLRQ